jgi:cell division protein FtsI (penicillin-binding protein 3)
MVMQSRRRIKKSGRSGWAIVVLFAVIVAGVAGGAFFYTQEITGFARQMFSDHKKSSETPKSKRGTIYDRNFKELALSLDRVSVYVKPRELVDLQGNIEQLATVLGIQEQDLLDRLGKETQQVWLAKNISIEEEKAVTELHLPGVYLDQEEVRFYPYKGVAAHVIGFADHNMGLAGAENYYNRLLDQASISQDDFPHIDLQGHSRTGLGGQHLVLSIDLKIQEFLEKYVATLGVAHEGAKLTALLMETKTGAIVANANFPSYDPNTSARYQPESLVNILLEPVSLPPEIGRFFQAAISLQASGNSENLGIPWSIAASASVPESETRLWEKLGLAADIDLDFSTPKSQGDGVGHDQDLSKPDHESGTLPKAATPMQMLLAINYLLNDGDHVAPHVFDRVLERSSEREYPFKFPVDPAPSDAQGAEADPGQTEIQHLFASMGEKGVLDSVFVDDQSLSFRSVVRGGEYLRHKMMFALVPADKPELILMVVMRLPSLEPSSPAAHNSLDLVGPAGKILPSMVALQQVHKNLSDMMSVAERKESNYQKEQGEKSAEALKTVLDNHHPLMPDLVGMSLRRALRLLQDAKFKVRIQGSGRVVSQSPAAGKPLDGVKECLLTLKKDEKAGKELSVTSASPGDGKLKSKVENKK